MADKNMCSLLEGGDAAIAKAKDFWGKNNNIIMGRCAEIITLGGGWLIYEKMFKGPEDQKRQKPLSGKQNPYYRKGFYSALHCRVKWPQLGV